MRRRKLGRSGLEVSEIGLGCEHLEGMEADAVFAVVDAALKEGVDLLDIFMSEPNVRTNIGRALAGRRETVKIQGHIGAIWEDGQYKRSRNLDECREAFEDLLQRLDTDYIDIGMIHFVDTAEDFEMVFHTELIEYAKDLKKRGVIRTLGMSSHNPLIAAKAVETGLLDVLMFSVNPAYDILPGSSDLDSLFLRSSYQKEGVGGVDPDRERLYRLCEANGVGITVMKGLAAGALLAAEKSPFGKALTPVQCEHYALTRPAVASILTGCRTPVEVSQAVAYEEASEAERDYSEILSAAPLFSMEGKCMYCNHCLPCPSRIDVASVNKYLDLARLGETVPTSVKEHYEGLNAHGSDCIECGSCESNCPFGVPVIRRMAEAAELFGK